MARNLSINHYYIQRGQTQRPSLRFSGKTRADFDAWHAALQPAVIATLGIMPKKVPLNPEVIAEWTEDGLIKQRVLFDVEEGLSAAAYIFRPAGKTNLPAILACHGHGPFGKEAVMGNRTLPELAQQIAKCNYDYGLQMAQAGFVTLAIDWRGFGERDDRRKPFFHDLTYEDLDQCNIHNNRSIMLGTTLLGQNIHDGMCALDYLCAQPFVNPEKIGAMGLSFGGTMTTWMSICDPRIKAADIICYSDRFAEFGMRDVNICGGQLTPGIYALCDVPDLHGLTAPRPLLIEIGLYDDCFLIEPALSCYKELEKIYAAAGIRDKLELDLFEGGHRWGANKSIAFFTRWLSGNPK